MFQFGSDGQGRGTADVPPSSASVTNIDFAFDGTVTSPDDTIISLFDPGAGNPPNNGPFTYNFDAYYRGVPVDTSSWTITVVDPYLLAGTPANWSWNAAAATYTLTAFPSAGGGNFPDTIVFIDTHNTTFDRLVLAASGIAVDTMAVGIGSATLLIFP